MTTAPSKPPPGMSMPDLLALPVSFGLPVAAKALSIGKNKAYEMVADGTFPSPSTGTGASSAATGPTCSASLACPRTW